jgi:hypothetical protein
MRGLVKADFVPNKSLIECKLRKLAGSLMLAKLKTFTLVGIEALPVEVEVDVSPSGLPKQVGLEINTRRKNGH